ncbi:MAG: zinc ribbon domain-containing protein, partial [Acidobacteria bacterium]|nr:zinc ribbon domain-containing protein [Acidobacteriota bacterium]
MRCSKCGRDNREGRKFCATCDAPLTVTCPKCDATNQPGEKFCGECGAGLAEAAGTESVEVTHGRLVRELGARGLMITGNGLGSRVLARPFGSLS